MSDQDEAIGLIIDAARRIIIETRQIESKLDEVQKHVQIRKAAVRRLARLTDVTVDLLPATMSIVPYEDALLLEIHKAGTAGTTRYHLKQMWRQTFGRECAPAALDSILKSLEDQGAIVDRGGNWAIPPSDTPLSAAAAPGSMKRRVVRILEAQTTGMRLQAISDELARLYGTDVPVNVISPLLSRLKRAGLVVHEGHQWRLVPSAAEPAA